MIGFHFEASLFSPSTNQRSKASSPKQMVLELLVPPARRRRNFLPGGLLSPRNVKLSLGFACLGALISTIAQGHMFSAFVFELYGSNAAVGLTDSVSGITGMVTAIPIGFAVDRLPRTKLLRACAGIGLLAALLGALAVCLGPKAVQGPQGERVSPSTAYTALLVAYLSLWGTFFSTAVSAVLALFADSVPKGSVRQDLYATKSTLTFLALAGGPFLALVGTRLLGNKWELEQMVLFLIPGFLLMPLASLLLLGFEEVRNPETDDLRTSLLEKKDTSSGDVEKGSTEDTPAKRGAGAVPYLLLTGEFVTALGAGMTVKFFGLWFKNTYEFTPAGLSALQAAAPIAIAVAVQALQAAVRRCKWGPVPVVLVFWFTSIGLLLTMTIVTDWQVLVVLHLLRTAFANCKEPVTRAILADAIPSSQRGRWNSIHSLTGIGFTGSAALGGFLCDRYGYGKTFAFTAGIYALSAIFCWVPLIYLVPHQGSLQDGAASKRKIVQSDNVVNEKQKGA